MTNLSDSELAQIAIDSGLTPLALEVMMREHVPDVAITERYRIGLHTLAMIRKRWGLHHLSGREKSNVTIVRSVQQ